MKIRCVCDHINKRNFGNVVILENGDALCFDCYSKIDTLTEKDLVFVCSKCLKELIEQFEAFLLKNNQDKNLYILGLENLNDEKGSIDPDVLIDEIYQKPIDHGIWKDKLKRK